MGSCRLLIAVLPAYRLGWVPLLLLLICPSKSSRDVLAILCCRLPLSHSHFHMRALTSCGAEIESVHNLYNRQCRVPTNTETLHRPYRSKERISIQPATPMSNSNPPSGTSTPTPRFASSGHTAEDLLKEQTVGLVHLSDFRKRRAEALELTGGAGSGSGDSTPGTASRYVVLCLRASRSIASH
jgi:hypothetical protein